MQPLGKAFELPCPRPLRIYPRQLTDFLQCRHLARLRLDGERGHSQADEAVAQLRQLGLDYEETVVASLEGGVCRIDPELPEQERLAATAAALAEPGLRWIHQGLLAKGELYGIPDLLERTAQGWAVRDVKLACQPRPEHWLQLEHYRRILAELELSPAPAATLIMGDGRQVALDPEEVRYFHAELLQAYRAFAASGEPTEPRLVPYCQHCEFGERCRAELAERADVAELPGLDAVQAQALRAAGLRGIAAVAQGGWRAIMRCGLERDQAEELVEAAQAWLEGRPRLRSEAFRQRLGRLLQAPAFLAVALLAPVPERLGQKLLGVAVKRLGGAPFVAVALRPEEERALLERLIRWLHRASASGGVVWHAGHDLGAYLQESSAGQALLEEEVDEMLHQDALAAIMPLIRSGWHLPRRQMRWQDLAACLRGEEPAMGAASSCDVLFELERQGCGQGRLERRLHEELEALGRLVESLPLLLK